MALLAGPLPAGPAAPPGDAAPDPFQLSARLDTIRQRDWDLSVGEATPGIAVLAIPVRRGVGGVVAALALAGPREAMLEGERPRHLDALRVRAGELERVLATTGRRGPG
jgi:DNA-binding IclR family transcriptional regulator